jgi:hypothetical protein
MCLNAGGHVGDWESSDLATIALHRGLSIEDIGAVAANLRGRKRYPGMYAGTVALLRGKAKPDTLKDWCSGAELLARRHAIDEALRSLDEYRGGRGHGAGLRDWWRNKCNFEIEEARKARQAP